jgi:hypothetical protein
MEKKLICNKCLIKPICQIACDELLDYNFELEDFKNEKVLLRLLKKGIEKTFKFGNIKIKFESKYYCWYKNGKLHREDGPAIEWSNGYKEWWINGNRHRENGPAIEYISGTKKWFKNGERHREDGPAIELSNGYKEWWINGERINMQQMSD